LLGGAKFEQRVPLLDKLTWNEIDF